MSNLYKQRYVVTDGTNTRIINSNALVQKKMNELAKQTLAARAVQPDGFVAGLNPEAVEVVPKEETISMEELLEQKTAEAEEILSNARQQAQAIVSEAEGKAESVLENARQTGYEEGLSEGRQQAQQELDERRQQMDEEGKNLQEAYQKQMEELEPKLVDVIAEVFAEVFHVQFDDKKEILIYLIQNTILSIEGTKEFQIKVGTEDFKFLESHMDEIAKQVGKSVNVELIPDSGMKDGQCVIETDSGIFDCGRDVQLENLVKAIRSLSLR